MSSPRVARNRHDRPVSPPPSPSLLNRLWLSVRPGGLLTVKNQAQGVKRRLTVTRKTQKKPKNGPRRRVSSAPRPATGADWADWYDVGRMTKDMPPDNALPRQRQRMAFMRSRVITADACDTGRVTIDMLPEDALLVMFGFYLDDSDSKSKATSINGWHTLVHVCQKWRNVVFGSPQRLNLQLHCTPKTPATRMLDMWPPLPIVIHHFDLQTDTSSEWGMDNIITALKHNDRVCQIALKPIPGWQWGKFRAAMSHPYPELTHLRLKADDERETPPVAPDSFLGGSTTGTPNLRFLWLERIPYPGLPNVLLSAADLVDLRLWDIPHSGYISPDAMVICLTARENQRRPLSTRSVLPALTRIWFRGSSEYLDDLVAQIDAPLLNGFFICFFHQLIFDTPELAQFISRTPTLKLHKQSQMLCFSDWGASVIFLREGTSDKALQLGILCEQPDGQLSSLGKSAPQHLSVLEETLSPPHWKDDIENSQWLKLLHPFTAVKNLYLSKEFAPRIASSLQELVGERATEVLPALQELSLEKIYPSRPVQKAIGKFVEARRLSNLP
ncbi:hypothetical protein BGY98DRAFT_984119 [Russula aff. rugulosa BPL654]|nr:hypothetical protein BGY98DRAFT_984119 [Russula aff. rugulosa BPL654]